jgi:hypothetical protein
MAPSSSLVVSSLNPADSQILTPKQNKLKVQLKLSISRLRMIQQKDSAKAKQQRREMAQLLEVHTHPNAFSAQSPRHLLFLLRLTLPLLER